MSRKLFYSRFTNIVNQVARKLQRFIRYIIRQPFCAGKVIRLIRYFLGLKDSDANFVNVGSPYAIKI